MEPIKLAFLGCGDVAQRDYLPELHRIADRIELVAVCGRTEGRVRAVAEQYDAGAWFTDYEKMLAQCEIDAVVNLTPIQLHAETNLAILQAGAHLFSEKPIAPTSAAAHRLQTEAAQRRLKVVAAPCVMLFPQVRYAGDLIAQGELGAVYSAIGHGHGGVPPWHGYGSDPSQFFIEGGGPAMDMGVYPLHALTGLLGPVKRVAGMTAQAQTGFTVPDGPAAGKEVAITVPDNWTLLLDFGDARLATVGANNVVQGTRAPQMEVRGLQGSVAVDLLDVSAPVDVLRAQSGWESVNLPRTGRAAGPDHLLGVAHLLDCIEHDTQPLLNIDHARHVVEILEKAARSSDTGEILPIESTFPHALALPS